MDIEWAKVVERQPALISFRPVPKQVKAAITSTLWNAPALKEKARFLCSRGVPLATYRGRAGYVIIHTSARWTRFNLANVLVSDIDRSRLGTGDEAVASGDCHQPRRRTCHAGVIARELGIPAVVGNRQTPPRNSMMARSGTVSCAEGDTGHDLRRSVVLLIFATKQCRRDATALPFKIMMNVGNSGSRV